MSSEPARRVLVVEDEALTRKLVAAAIERLGYEVEEAVDGGTALAACRRRDFAVIVLDLALPGLDGVGFVESYRELPEANARIVVISGGVRADEIAARLGADAYLLKPFSMDELGVQVQRLMDSPKT